MMERCSELLSKFIGDAHRPATMLIIAISFLWAVVNKQDALVLGAIGTVVLGLYGTRAWENNTQTKADADVKKAQVGQ